jgi:hypothetical protein
MEHMSRAVEGVLRNLNSEQLEGALFLLVTLHDSLLGIWARQGQRLDESAIAEIFDKLSEICSSLRTVTKRYKSGEWMSGALEIIEELRQQLRILDGSRYDRQALVDRLRDLIETADNCVDCLGR